MAESKVAARNLSVSLDLTGAALAQGLLDHPEWMADAADDWEAEQFSDADDGVGESIETVRFY